MVEVIKTCPLGSVCEEVKDGKIHRCSWYTKIVGVDAQGNEHDEFDCAIAWNPIIQLEVAKTNRQTASAVESFRNVTDMNQRAALLSLQDFKNAKKD